MSADELSGFLEKLSSRYEADRERLQAMMRYGETTLCRMKYIREYFGEPPGEECGHCDNCRAPAVRAPPMAGEGMSMQRAAEERGREVRQH